MIKTEALSFGSEREPWSSKVKTVLGIGLAALAVATGGTVYQYDRSQKFPTPDEKRAQDDIQQIFTTMSTDNILECSVSGPPFAEPVVWPLVGPTIGRRANTPGISVNVTVEQLLSGQDSDLQSNAGRYNAAISWQSIRLESRIRSVPPPTNDVAHTNDQSSRQMIETTSSVYDFFLKPHQVENVNLNLPLDSELETSALIDIVPIVDGLTLSETAHGKLNLDSALVQRELVGEACVTLSVLMRRHQIEDIEMLRYN